VTIYYRLSSSALNGIDYSNLTGVVTIPAGPGYANVEVEPVADGLVEGTETVTLTIVQTNHYLILPEGAAATVTIRDSSTTVDIYPTGDALEPGGPPGAAGSTGSFSLERSDERDNYPSLTVHFLIAGTASNGVDYTALSGTVNFAADAISTNVDITPLLDGIFEGIETVTLTLIPTNTYQPAPNVSTGTILISESTTTVSISASTNAVETNSASGVPGRGGSFLLSRVDVRGLLPALTVAYQVSGTASNGVDYNNLPGTVTFPSNVTSVGLLVTPLEDNQFEGDESVTVTLLNTNGSYVINAKLLILV
jgi:S-adenosylmethionine/arginine decarboxylase-like enzyme